MRASPPARPRPGPMPPPRGAWAPQSPHRGSRLHPRPHRAGVQGRQDPLRPARRTAWRARGSVAAVRPRTTARAATLIRDPPAATRRPRFAAAFANSPAPSPQPVPCSLHACDYLAAAVVRMSIASGTFGLHDVWGRHDHRRSAESPSQPCDRSCGSTGPRERRRRRPSPAPPGNHRACPATAALGGSNHRPPWACVPPDCACVRSGWNSSAFRTLTAPRRLDSTDESSASGHLPLWAHGSKVEFDVSDYGFAEQGRQIA